MLGFPIVKVGSHFFKRESQAPTNKLDNMRISSMLLQLPRTFGPMDKW